MKILKKIISAVISMAAAANLCVFASANSAENGLKDVTVVYNIDGEDFTYGVSEVKGALFKAEKLSDTSCRLLFENLDVDIGVTDSIEIIPIDESKLEAKTKAYGEAAPYQVFCGLRTDKATVFDGKNYTDIPIKKNYYTLNGKRAVEIIFEKITSEKLLKTLTEYDAMGVYFMDIGGHTAANGEASAENIPLVRKSDEKISIEEKGNILIGSHGGSPMHFEIITDEETVVKTGQMGKSSVVIRFDNIKFDLLKLGAVNFMPVYTEKMPKQFSVATECCPFLFDMDFIGEKFICFGSDGLFDDFKVSAYVTKSGVYSFELELDKLREDALKALVEADGMIFSIYDSENAQMFLPSGRVAGDDVTLLKKTAYPVLTDSDVDVNGDGKANSMDALYILKEKTSGKELGDELDVDGNGAVNSLDVLMILRYLVK